MAAIVPERLGPQSSATRSGCRRYGARRDVLGRQLVLDDVAYEIVGVMPAGFEFPSPDVSFWIPMRLDPRNAGDYWGLNACSTFARLREGVTPQAAISELRGWTPRVHAMFPWRMPDSWGDDITLEPMREHMVAGVTAAESPAAGRGRRSSC